MDTLTNLYDEHSDWLSPTVSVYRGRNPSCGAFLNECPVTGMYIFTYRLPACMFTNFPW
jgi:hypothetical protein